MIKKEKNENFWQRHGIAVIKAKILRKEIVSNVLANTNHNAVKLTKLSFVNCFIKTVIQQ